MMQTLESNHPNIIRICIGMRNALQKQANNVRALNSHEKIMTIVIQAFVSNHLNIVMCLKNTNSIYQKQRNIWRHQNVIDFDHYDLTFELVDVRKPFPS
jgi:hypothetical protein